MTNKIFTGKEASKLGRSGVSARKAAKMIAAGEGRETFVVLYPCGGESRAKPRAIAEAAMAEVDGAKLVPHITVKYASMVASHSNAVGYKVHVPKTYVMDVKILG